MRPVPTLPGGGTQQTLRGSNIEKKNLWQAFMTNIALTTLPVMALETFVKQMP